MSLKRNNPPLAYGVQSRPGYRASRALVLVAAAIFIGVVACVVLVVIYLHTGGLAPE